MCSATSTGLCNAVNSTPAMPVISPASAREVVDDRWQRGKDGEVRYGKAFPMRIRAMIGPQYGRSARRERVSALTLVAAAVFAALTALASAKAEEPSKCAVAPHLLWGDGEHDDTAALN